MSNLTDLYQEVIIDHNKKPRNFGVLENSTHQAEGFNPLCGDEIKLYLTVHNNIIEKISFTGKGCAISTASASLMTENLWGKTIEEAESVFTAFRELMLDQESHKDQTDVLKKLLVLTGVKEFPSRIKCATLAWHALHAALLHKNTSVSTES